MARVGLFCFFYLLFLIGLKAQDKIILRYDVGVFALDSTQKRDLLNAIHSYSKYSIDSIIIRGFADSLGNYQTNLELSRKRAKGVADYFRRELPYRVKFKYYAVGEASKKIENIDRRVEVLIHAKEQSNDTLPDTVSMGHPKCITTAYDVLSVTRIYSIRKLKTDFVVLEMEANHLLSGKKRIKDSLYYAVVSKDSTIRYVKLKWRKRGSGVLWWARTRYQIEVPKSNFDSHKVFYLADLPCKVCGYVIGDTLAIKPKIDSCLVNDAMISYNIQYKSSLFNRKFIEIRVPREFVSQDLTYYYLSNSNDYLKLDWLTKSGKRNGVYFFAALPLKKDEYKIEPVFHTSPILKSVACCHQIDTFKYEHYKGFMPGPCLWNGSIELSGEVGNYHFQRKDISYVGLGIYKEGTKDQFNLMVGIDINKNSVINLRYQYNYLTMPFALLNPFSSWGDFSVGVFKERKYFFRLYTGSSLTIAELNQVGRFTHQDLHLGVSIASEKSVIKRIYCQYGYGYDYTQSFDRLFTPILNYGIIFRLIEIVKSPLPRLTF